MDLSFIERLDERIKPAWKVLFDRFYCEKTKLLYDYVAIDGPDGYMPAMPTLEMIEKGIPNPSGWATPLEDNENENGYILLSLLMQYRISHDESIIPVFHDLLKGFLSCATIPTQRGFLARGISPIDGKSYYSNSSRDHYTYWICNAMTFYNCELITQEEKVIIADCFVGFAEKAEKEIYGDKYEFLRADGKIDLLISYDTSI